MNSPYQLNSYLTPLQLNTHQSSIIMNMYTKIFLNQEFHMRAYQLYAFLQNLILLLFFHFFRNNRLEIGYLSVWWEFFSFGNFFISLAFNFPELKVVTLP